MQPSQDNEPPNEQLQELYFTIDRFEDGGWAVLEMPDGLSTFNVPADWLPDEASEGDVLRLLRDIGEKESAVRFIIDEEAREVRLRHIEALRARIKKGPEGDLEL